MPLWRQRSARSGLAPERLGRNHDSLLINNPDAVMVEKLARLEDLGGVTVAMDDFGTGYSSTWPIFLKFPPLSTRSRSTNLSSPHPGRPGCPRHPALHCLALQNPAHESHRRRRVETLEQVDFLYGIARHHLQGYYFSRPLGCRRHVSLHAQIRQGQA